MGTGRFDEITEGLRGRRIAVGEPSYGELVRRVVALRVGRGLTEWEARVGRTTVYDAFRPGRQKLDPALVRDLVLALGGTPGEALVWERRCGGIVEPASPSGPGAAASTASARSLADWPAPVAPPPTAPALAAPDRASHPDRPPPPAPPPPEPRGRPRLPRRGAIALLMSCVALNLADRVLVNVSHLPLYLDMVGTAVAAVIIGPWPGVAVGIATTVLGALTNGWVSVPFIPVEVVGALIWGYGVRRFGLGRSVPRFLLLNVLVALACSVVAVPIIFWVDHGVTGSGADQMTRSMQTLWHSLFVAVASSNVLTSMADKLISGFFALSVAEALPIPALPRLRLTSPWLQMGGDGRADTLA